MSRSAAVRSVRSACRLIKGLMNFEPRGRKNAGDPLRCRTPLAAVTCIRPRYPVPTYERLDTASHIRSDESWSRGVFPAASAVSRLVPDHGSRDGALDLGWPRR